MKSFLGLFTFLFFVVSGFTQGSSRVYVLDEASGLPIPFSKVSSSSTETYMPISGHIFLNYGDSIRVENPLYFEQEVIIDKDSVVVLLKRRSFDDIPKGDTSGVPVMRRVVSKKQENDIYAKRHFRYKSYNKAAVESNDVKKTEGFIQELLDLFTIKLDDVEGNRHLILAESVTEREYLNEFNDKEVIHSSKVSGIQNPRVLTLNSQLHSISLYEKYIRVIDKFYLSPIHRNSHRRYDFSLVDSLVNENETIYCIKFNPNGRLKEVLLSGILYISSDNWAVKNAIIFPDKKSSTEFQVNYSYVKNNESWIPKTYSTTMFMEKFFVKGVKLNARFVTHITDFEFNSFYKRNITDDISIEYIKDDSELNSSYLSDNRLEEFSTKDSMTYEYYQNVGTLENIDFALDFAEHLYDKEIKMRHFNFDFKRAVDFNQYEGLRLGIGANKVFLKKKFKVGGYMAYGLQDNLAKGGLRLNMKVLPLNKLDVFVNYSSDVSEAAGSKFLLYNYQYSTEWLRRFSVQNFDFQNVVHFGVRTSPIKYTTLELGYERSNQHSLYHYSYRDKTDSLYKYSEVQLGVKIALGETFFRLYNNKYPLKSHYPKLWMKFNWGNDWLDGQYDYFKFESRLEYTFRSFLLGKAHVQMNFGYAEGDLPYYKLYEGYGANGAAVAHNRFETMQINEFLSSVYFNTFMTYEVAKLYFRQFPKFRPSIEVSYNYGVGTLLQHADHRGVEFRTMEQSYHEAGFAIRDMVNFKIVAVRVGIGYANYFRLGAYSYDVFERNYVGKIIFTFAL